MAETAALLIDEVLPRVPTRLWVLSLPFALRYLLATRPEVLTHVIFEPEDFIARLVARLVALVPKPRAHLTRNHGVFAPSSALRSRVVPRSGTVGKTAPPNKTEA